MTCDHLADTGATTILLIVVIALACLVAGTILALSTRRHRAVLAAAVLAIVVTSAAMTMPVSTASAATSDCTFEGTSVSVIQTSTMDALAPGVAPAAIAGLVTNTSSDTVHVIAVDVVITSISVSPASDGTSCDATDYLLLDTQMPVGRTIAAGERTAFAGASIGFVNKPTIQDDCQNATVHLLYTVDAHHDVARDFSAR